MVFLDLSQLKCAKIWLKGLFSYHLTQSIWQASLAIVCFLVTCRWRLSKCAKELAQYFHRCVSFDKSFPTKLCEKVWQKFAWASWKDLTKELWTRLHGDYTAFLVLTKDLSNKTVDMTFFFIIGANREKMAIHFQQQLSAVELLWDILLVAKI